MLFLNIWLYISNIEAKLGLAEALLLRAEAAPLHAEVMLLQAKAQPLCNALNINNLQRCKICSQKALKLHTFGEMCIEDFNISSTQSVVFPGWQEKNRALRFSHSEDFL